MFKSTTTPVIAAKPATQAPSPRSQSPSKLNTKTQKSPSQQPIYLTHRRIYIVPSRNGLVFAVILAVMLLGSMNYNNSMGFLLTFILGSMSLAAVLHTYRNVAHLIIDAAPPTPLFAGEICQFPLWLQNQGQPARYALRLQRHWSGQPAEAPVIVDVTENCRQRVDLPVLAPQRGQLSLGRVKLSTVFPLGLFYAWTYLEFAVAEALVYPRPAGHAPAPLGAPSAQGERQEAGAQGEDFTGYRAYQLGDSPRHVDWKAVARERGWLIKQFGGEAGNRIHWFSWDDVAALGHTEAGLSQLCRWIVEADAQQQRYGLRLPGFERAPSQGEAHRHACLQALALFGQ